MSISRFRLAVVLSHPTQYYSPWFRWIAANTNLVLKVYYCWDFGITYKLDPLFQSKFRWDVDLVSGYDSELVLNCAPSPGSDRFWGLVNPTLPVNLIKWRPDGILLFGYSYATHLYLIAVSRLIGVPLIFRGDSHLLGREAFSGIRQFLLKLVYRQFAAVTYVGQANKEYFQKLGVPGGKLFFSPHSVNHEHFNITENQKKKAHALREELGILGRKVVLYAGKFVGSKQPIELCKAFLSVASPKEDALVYVGDGPLKDSLHELAARNPNYCIRFLPFANQSEMPARYLIADIFALPSIGFYETWGLAINEAMHMGVPCLVSNRVGCQKDLISDGLTGWVFESASFDSLRAKMLEALSADLRSFKASAQSRVSSYTYEQSTNGLMAAVEYVKSRR